MHIVHHPDDIIRLFNDCFLHSCNTRLEYGDSEPYYLPEENGNPAIIYFAHGFYSSALHEIAHWLVAGVERRRLADYGYWYQPDTRDKTVQALFEQVEARNQSLEWILARAANFPFQPSVDNLNSAIDVSRYDFLHKVHEALLQRCKAGLTKRSATFVEALARFYKVDFRLDPSDFAPEFQRLASRYRLA